MKSTIRHYVTLAACLFTICGPIKADQKPSNESRELMDPRTLLERGQASGAMPEGMVIRICACLGEVDPKAQNGQPDELREMWEFTSDQVHRVEMESKDGHYSFRRLESRPFDSKGICKELLDGKAIEIQTRKGEGPKTAFVGTCYGRGSRTIEVVWKGTPILDLHETNGPVLDEYRESDARAFGTLYERLAGHVRVLFKSKAAEGN